MKPPSPAWTASALLAAAGVAIVAVNGAEPDESRWLGVGFALAGLFCAAREAARPPGLAAAWAFALVLAGGEVGLRWQNEKARAAYASDRVRMMADPELRYERLPGARAARASSTRAG